MTVFERHDGRCAVDPRRGVAAHAELIVFGWQERLAGMWIMTMKAGDALVVHAAGGERGVFEDLVSYLSVGVV